jgi:twitching motility protein PilT
MVNELDIFEMFEEAVKNKCSDIHIKPGAPPKMRKDGVLKAIPGYESVVLTGEQTSVLTHETMDATAFSKYSSVGCFQVDYSCDFPNIGRFRVNAYKTRGQDAFVARLLQDRAKTLDELGVDMAIKALALKPNGLIIVTGATGSGKSTTMAGMVEHINTNKPVNIISIEDPIEILLQDAMASISQREIGSDVESFDDALSAALREDPDVILIGEIRLASTLKTALQAADTGHLVIATLHTTDTS